MAAKLYHSPDGTRPTRTYPPCCCHAHPAADILPTVSLCSQPLPGPGRYEISTFRKIEKFDFFQKHVDSISGMKILTIPKVDFNNFSRKKRLFTTKGNFFLSPSFCFSGEKIRVSGKDADFLSPGCYWWHRKHLERSLLRKHLSSLLLLFFLVC